MSWGTCYRGSNNVHAGFPALMSEGLFATDWNTACTRNNLLKRRAGVSNNYNYRQYLIKNADSLIKDNQVAACDDCCACWQNFGPRPVDRFPHYIFKSCTDKTTPYGYQHSDLKNMYLTRCALESRLAAPIMTQASMLATGQQNWN